VDGETEAGAVQDAPGLMVGGRMLLGP
jgi:hypothetical protein